MPEQAQPTAKICVRCGVDCSGKPRTRDERGRYTCKPCFDAHSASPAAEHRASGLPTAGATEDLANGFSLADHPPPDPPAHAKAVGGPCPECGSFLPGTTVVCTRCGFNRKTGRAVSTHTTTEADPVETARQKRKREFAKASRKEYAKAGVMAAVGIVIGLLLVTNAPIRDPIAAYMMTIGVYFAIAALVYVMCCLTWVGFDASLPLSLARIFAVCTIMALVYVITAVMPFYFGRMSLIAIVYAGLLTQLADIEFEDAVFIGLITGGAWMIGTYAILAAMAA